jgi:hypothetical protein
MRWLPIKLEFDPDPGGLGRPAVLGHGIQKVGGSKTPVLQRASQSFDLMLAERG